MRSANVAELKRHLSKYLALAKNGEEIVIRDRTLPVARLNPFTAENANKQELLLVAAGKLQLPAESVDLEQLLTVPSGRNIGRSVTRALLEERGRSR